MGKEHRINLSEQAGNHHAVAIGGLEAAAEFAELGERFGTLPAEVALPPAAITMKFGESGAETAEHRQRFASDCARFAAVGMITACDLYLGQLCFLADLASKALGSGRRMEVEEFWEIAEVRRKELKRMGLATVTTEIDRSLGTKVRDLPEMDWFQSLNDLRHCLVHRGGQVGVEDLNSGGELRVRWRKPVFEVDDRRVEALPFHVEKGEVVAISFDDGVKSWRLGEPVVLTANECQEMAFTLALLCNDVLNEFQSGLQPLTGSTSEPTP